MNKVAIGCKPYRLVDCHTFQTLSKKVLLHRETVQHQPLGGVVSILQSSSAALEAACCQPSSGPC